MFDRTSFAEMIGLGLNISVISRFKERNLQEE